MHIIAGFLVVNKVCFLVKKINISPMLKIYNFKSLNISKKIISKGVCMKNIEMVLNDIPEYIQNGRK